MKLEDKKKIAYWMGWDVFDNGTFYRPYGRKKKYQHQCFEPDNWNPDTDRNVWPEIWESMDYKTWKAWKDWLINFFNKKYKQPGCELCLIECFLTASPEICAKALLEVLEAGE